MKTHSVARFDKKALIVQMYKEIRLMKHTAQALAEMCQDSEDRVNRELGLVPPEPESKKDVIEIDRRVAEDFIGLYDEDYFEKGTIASDMRKELSKALSEGSAK